MATKFCPIRPVNLMVALLSVFTTASGCSFMVTLTFRSASAMFSTRPISTPAILTLSPDLQVLRGVEQGVDVVAAAKHFHAAQGFHDGPGGKHHQDHKNAEPGFE